MKTKHKSLVLKVICSLCKWAISTVPNLRVHLKRMHGIQMLNDKIEGKALKWVWVDKKDLMNGRYYGAIDSSDSSNDESTPSTPVNSSTYDDDDEIPLAQLARPIPQQSPLQHVEGDLSADDMAHTDAPIDDTADDEQQPLHPSHDIDSGDDTDRSLFEMLQPECVLEVDPDDGISRGVVLIQVWTEPGVNHPDCELSLHCIVYY